MTNAKLSEISLVQAEL